MKEEKDRERNKKYMKKVRFLSAITLLAGCVVFYFADILFSDKLFSFRDLSRYYYPLRLFAFSQLKSGSFPFWNPYVGCGHPLFAALQSVVLYPLSIVYILFEFDFAFNFFIILHIFLGGLFFYLLMRDTGHNHTASLISGITFMFSGYLIGVINLTTTLAAAVWFPLVFLFYRRALEYKKFLYIVLTAVSLGCMLLGGEPTPLYATILALVLFSTMYVLSDPGKIVKVFTRLAAIIFICALLGAFQIIPFVELIRLSHRTHQDFQAAAQWSFPPRDIINFLLPFFYGPLYLQEETPFRQDWLLLTYFGAVTMILFSVAVFLRRGRQAAFFKIIFALGLVLVCGSFTPVYKLCYNYLPGFSFIRYPIKFFFLTAVAFAYLCGSGWQEYYNRSLVKDAKLLRYAKILFVCGFTAAIAFFVLYSFSSHIYTHARMYVENLHIKDDAQRLRYFTMVTTNFFNFRRMLVFFILTTLALFIGTQKKKALPFVGACMIAFVFIDLYGGKTIEVNPAISKKVFHTPSPNILFLQKDTSLFRVYTSSKLNKANEVLKGSGYNEAFTNSLDNFTPNRLIEYGIQDSRGYFSIHNMAQAKVFTLLDTAPAPSATNILNMLNIKYILTPEEIKDPACRLLQKGLSSYVYENKNVLPRAYLVPEYRVLPNEMDIARRMRSRDFYPEREVILEKEPQPAIVSVAQEAVSIERVDVQKYQPNQVVITATVVEEPKFLVLADNYYPGWQVYVDGKKDMIYKANFMLRAVRLSPGAHVVRFVFRPVSFYIGLAISVITFVSLVIILVFRR